MVLFSMRSLRIRIAPCSAESDWPQTASRTPSVPPNPAYPT